MRGIALPVCGLALAAALVAPVLSSGQVVEIGAALDIALKVKSLFSAPASGVDLGPLAAAIEGIKADVRRANGQLDRIVGLLQALDVRIDEKFAALPRNEVLGAVDVISDNYQGWVRAGARPAAATQLSVFDNHLRTLMRSSYADYPVVGVAMGYEHALQVFVGTPTVTRKNTFGSFAAYFRQAQDPTVGGSVGDRKRRVEEAIAEIDRDVQARQPLFCDHEPWVQPAAKTDVKCGADGRHWLIRVGRVTEGNMNDGFNAAHNLYKFIAVEHYSQMLGLVCTPDPDWVPAGPRLDSCEPYMNSQRASRQYLVSQLERLNQALQSARSFETTACEEARHLGMITCPPVPR